MDTQEDIRIKLDIEIETQSNIVKTLKIQKADKKCHNIRFKHIACRELCKSFF